eukprot:CAMPEP_0195150122 /NCGR_PEP_ID=MMETSP0448-20130528/178267_1 /TAXON_ID=66468 /ORGANISM="Heterocapsa triquestra, Strain CCMP 448" /LENGTH=40 /DNA_ID= /DNA_START= /DNA_END= /DNA_ORIENTATION=
MAVCDDGTAYVVWPLNLQGVVNGRGGETQSDLLLCETSVR